MRTILALLAWLVAAPALAQPSGMIPVPPIAPGPAPGPARIVGGPGPGCIAGAERLPESGPGFMTVRESRSTFWGHPEVITALKLLGTRAQAAGLPVLLMNDISGPRGGPLVGGHVSHQLGLDADVYLDVVTPRPERAAAASRDAMDPPGLVRPDQRGVDMARWRPQHITLMKLAATLPGVDRVLVNAAIKQQLCREVPANDREWLRRIRPWYQHAAHMHIHFRCPAGNPECGDLPPIPPGDGCDASLQWWFDRLDQPPEKKPPTTAKPSRPMVPAACGPILTAATASSRGRP
ncbi:MAG: penicillin-insensitive murein endopeptidase [Alphaproteobacteria bacterium]|nr:penicillin-insensitive murein endopeptidase [Alphaproteobacteria bacterium]